MGPAARTELEASWVRLLTGLGCTESNCRRTFADLAARYASPERHYHTLEHIERVLETVRSLAGEPVSPALSLAAWFHDAVYDTRASDNEERSAAHARSVLQPLGIPEATLAETGRLILLTKAHHARAGDRDGEVLLDADLAVLGADEAEYDAYARAVRREYAWVPEEAYRTGRRRVLEDFLRRPRIYATETMFARREEPARRNLNREIAALTR